MGKVLDRSAWDDVPRWCHIWLTSCVVIADGLDYDTVEAHLDATPGCCPSGAGEINPSPPPLSQPQSTTPVLTVSAAPGQLSVTLGGVCVSCEAP